ncbi:MAG: hypothetical protein ABSH11_02930 [Verrucomicrobiota bacterium]|jgi:hypothetical protein
MKTATLVLTGLLITLTALAAMEMIFPGYDRLKEISPDIIIARCTNTPSPLPPNRTITSDANTFSIEIVAAIKGTNRSGSVLLNSGHWLHRGDNYLIFGDCENGVCQALADYRVIPLGRELLAGSITNAIASKPLDEQIQILFKRRLDNLNRQMKKEQEEKERLEETIKK